MSSFLRHWITLFATVLTLVTVTGFAPLSAAAAGQLDNRAALGELENIKAVYDVRKSHPAALDTYIKAIVTNVENLKKEGVQADLVMVFISHSVKFIHTEPSLEDEADHGDALASIARNVVKLQEMGGAWRPAMAPRGHSVSTTTRCYQASSRCAADLSR